ncbi:Putative Glycoside hydrolase family 18 protein [Rhizopus microsporus]|nr:Putative Glycoside hydrolase family 18 protein [Rhizopus microsporus]
MKKSLLILSLVIGLSTAFDNACNNNVVAYWGQNSFGAANSQDKSGWQKPLSFYCDDDSIDVFPISFLTTFFGPGNSPEINLANTCNSVDNSTFAGTALADCTSMASDIKYCQSKGKLVTLSLGGATGSVGFQSEDQANAFAETIWNVFLGGSSSTRPFGDAILDGIDLDIEGGGSNYYVPFLQKLSSYFDDSKKYYITAAPQCVFPDANLQNTLNAFPFDAVYVQFYNNPCGLQYFDSNQWNFGVWDNWARNSSPNPKVKVYIGAPASPSAAGSGYVGPDTLLKIAATTKESFPSFGGVMFWDASQAYANNNLAATIKNGLSSGKSCGQSFDLSVCTAPPYVTGTSYSRGSTVSYNGYTWIAKWYASSPPSSNPYSDWVPIKACMPNTSGAEISLPNMTPVSSISKSASSSIKSITSSRSVVAPTASSSATLSVSNTASPPAATGSPSTPSTCSGVPEWSPTIAYTGGNMVYYQDAVWKAKWWSQNDIPGGVAGVWEKVDACGQSRTLSARSIIEAAARVHCKRDTTKWNRFKKYSKGNRVLYKRSVYVASDSNVNEQPGSTSFFWQKDINCV